MFLGFPFLSLLWLLANFRVLICGFGISGLLDSLTPRDLESKTKAEWCWFCRHGPGCSYLTGRVEQAHPPPLCRVQQRNHSQVLGSLVPTETSRTGQLQIQPGQKKFFFSCGRFLCNYQEPARWQFQKWHLSTLSRALRWPEMHRGLRRVVILGIPVEKGEERIGRQLLS